MSHFSASGLLCPTGALQQNRQLSGLYRWCFYVAAEVGSWASTSVRCAAAIFPESEVDRTRRGHRENALMALNGSGRSRSVAASHMPDHDLVAAQFADRQVATDSASIVVRIVNVKIAPSVVAAIGECREGPQRARNGGDKWQFSHSNTPPCRRHYGSEVNKKAAWWFVQ
jgi:hypothetical protein